MDNKNIVEKQNELNSLIGVTETQQKTIADPQNQEKVKLYPKNLWFAVFTVAALSFFPLVLNYFLSGVLQVINGLEGYAFREALEDYYLNYNGIPADFPIQQIFYLQEISKEICSNLTIFLSAIFVVIWIGKLIALFCNTKDLMSRRLLYNQWKVGFLFVTTNCLEVFYLAKASFLLAWWMLFILFFILVLTILILNDILIDRFADKKIAKTSLRNRKSNVIFFIIFGILLLITLFLICICQDAMALSIFLWILTFFSFCGICAYIINKLLIYKAEKS